MYLSSQTVFGDVRDKFVQLQQISMLLNLNHVHPFFNSIFFSSGVILMLVIHT